MDLDFVFTAIGNHCYGNNVNYVCICHFFLSLLATQQIVYGREVRNKVGKTNLNDFVVFKVRNNYVLGWCFHHVDGKKPCILV